MVVLFYNGKFDAIKSLKRENWLQCLIGYFYLTNNTILLSKPCIVMKLVYMI